MATTEGKPETKQESKPAEAKQESNSKDVEEIQEPALKYKVNLKLASYFPFFVSVKILTRFFRPCF